MNTVTVTLSAGFVSFTWPSVPLATQYRIITTLATGGAQTSVSPAGTTSTKMLNPSGKFTVRVYADTPTAPIAVPVPISIFTPIPAAPAAIPAIPAPKIVHCGTMIPAQCHIDLTGLYPKPTLASDVPIVATDFGDGTTYAVQPGCFNAAHLYTTAGIYAIKVTVNGKLAGQVFTPAIAQNLRKLYYVSPSGSDTTGGGLINAPWLTLAHALTAAPSNADIALQRGAVYSWTVGLAPKLTTVVIFGYGDGAPPVIKYVGPRINSPYFMTLGAGSSDVTFQGVAFDSIYNQDCNYSDNNAIMIAGAVGVTIANCNFYSVDYGVTVNSGCAVLVIGNVAPQVYMAGGVLLVHGDDTTSANVTGLRANFGYVGGGSYIAFVGNVVANSTREHCIRVEGGSFVTATGNDLTNLDRQPLDPSDISKSTLLMHAVSYGYSGNNLDRFGTPGAGPLNLPIAKTDPQYAQGLAQSCNWFVSENDTFYETTMCFQPGTSHVLVRNGLCNLVTGVGFLINGFSGLYNRGVTDAQFLGCKVNVSGVSGTALTINAPNASEDPLPAGHALASGIVWSGGTMLVGPTFAGGLAQSAFIVGDSASFATLDTSGFPTLAASQIDRHDTNGGMFFIDGKWMTAGMVEAAMGR